MIETYISTNGYKWQKIDRYKYKDMATGIIWDTSSPITHVPLEDAIEYAKRHKVRIPRTSDWTTAFKHDFLEVGKFAVNVNYLACNFPLNNRLLGFVILDRVIWNNYSENTNFYIRFIQIESTVPEIFRLEGE